MGLSMAVVALVVETPTSVSISEQVVVAITVLTTTGDMILSEVNKEMATTTCTDIATLVVVSTTSATTTMLNPMCGSTVATYTIGNYILPHWHSLSHCAHPCEVETMAKTMTTGRMMKNDEGDSQWSWWS